MSSYIGTEKPSLEELSHYGVKGMRWGVRKKYSAADIRAARSRQKGRLDEFTTARKAHAKSLSTNDGRKIGSTGATMDAKRRALLRHPDRAVALRMTRGEKAVTAILGGPLGVVAIGVTSAAVKGVERKNAKYTK